MRTILKLIGSLLIIILVIIGGLFLLKSYSFGLYEKHRQYFNDPFLSLLIPIKNNTTAESLLVQHAGKISFKVWAECYIGRIDLSITDPKGSVIYHKTGRTLDFEVSRYLAAGEYVLRLRFNRTFPAMAIMQIKGDTSQPAAYRIFPYLDKRLYTRISPNAALGFYWPYYLYMPPSFRRMTAKHLLVIPNNTGTCNDNLLYHETAAVELLTGSGAEFANALGSPLLIPVFPRPSKFGNVYTHALDRDSLQTEIRELKRLDLQLIAMIDDAREKLKQRGVDCRRKVWMSGFSAAGMFTNRFAVLHPERVQAAAVGSPGGWPIVPASRFKGRQLRYPIGVSDIEQLVAKPFNRKAFQKVPLYFFIGSRDTNDSVPFDDSYDTVDRPVINNNFGKTPVVRWSAAQHLYQNNRCHARFVTYPLIGHEVTPQMTRDCIAFFQKNQ